MKTLRYIIIASLCTIATLTMQPLQAQTATMRAGEVINYELYFNWKFVWKKVGTARFSVRDTRYEGRQAYRIDLETLTDGVVDKFFRMRDTLVSIVTPSMQPLYYRKAAAEGKNYYIDEARYSYAGGQTHIKLHQRKNLKEDYHGEYRGTEKVYDMLSILLNARAWDSSSWKPGHEIRFLMVSAEKVEKGLLRYRGKEVVEAKDKHSYRCLIFSFYEDNDKDRNRELIRFFITDDRNHMPIRLDMNLNFGSAKAFMKSVRGNQYPLTSRVK